mgnify:CR=1 FL=1
MIKQVIAALALMVSPAFAEVTYTEETRSLVISGPTSSYQSVMVARAFANHKVDTVYMWGPGGEFYAGLDIGRRIKNSGARVIVPSGAECISACALASMGANGVEVDGVILFHKPFAISVPSMVTIDEIAGHHGVAYLDMTQYIYDMLGDAGIQFARHLVANTTPCLFLSVSSNSDAISVSKGEFSMLSMDDRCNPA